MLESIKVKGHTGTWSEIMRYRNYILLESDQWGDETANLWVDEQMNVVLDDSYNGIVDLVDAELVEEDK